MIRYYEIDENVMARRWSGDPPRPLRILYVSYPLLTVTEESAGGAEQMLWTLEREMAEGGLSTTVAASTGSRVSGKLFDTGSPSTLPDDFERRNLEHQEKILDFLSAAARQNNPFDLIHDQSGSFWMRADQIETPVLATLHLPRDFYPRKAFAAVSENVRFNCVSESQAKSFTDLQPAVVANGISLHRFQPNFGPRNGLLWVGRICEEKGPHLALEIAARGHQPIILVGQIYPFSFHRRFFDREIQPRLQSSSDANLALASSFEQKLRLLQQAKVVLITSLADETSSLVAMEAAAVGTPVIAFRRGALPEIVRDGITGFVVPGVDEAVEALTRVNEIAPGDCVAHAREHFSSARMADQYEALYSQISKTHILGRDLNSIPFS